jgi:undecaprenyl diphosphate synthase
MAHGSVQDQAPVCGLHAAIIMDGNGRWAQARGRSRTAGHLAGADAVRRTVEAAPEHGIDVLTLYAFSSDNWRRPPEEVGALLRLLRRYLMAETGRCIDNGVRIQVIGRRDRLASSLVRVIESTEHATARGGKLWLRIAVDYSARDAILSAARRLYGETCAQSRGAGADLRGAGADLRGAGADLRGASADLEAERDALARLLAGCSEARAREVDLLIRTGGEKRLSDFLLWESAYAELIFTDRMWPDFGAADLREAVQEFRRRERRFGTVGNAGSRAPAVQATAPAESAHTRREDAAALAMAP